GDNTSVTKDVRNGVKSQPVSPINLGLVKSDTTYPERIQKLEQSVFECICYLIRQSKDDKDVFNITPTHPLAMSFVEYIYYDDERGYHHLTRFWLNLLEKQEEDKP